MRQLSAILTLSLLFTLGACAPGKSLKGHLQIRGQEVDMHLEAGDTPPPDDAPPEENHDNHPREPPPD